MTINTLMKISKSYQLNWGFDRMTTVLLTGGGGALGKQVAERFRSCGYSVVCGSRRTAKSDYECILDVTDADSVVDALLSVKPTLIVHLAATFVNNYDLAYSTNVLGAKNILTAVQKSGQPVRVVLAGSAAEYGLVAPEENPISEDRILRPVSIYGMTKSWQNSYGLMCSYQGMDVVVARIFNLDGEGVSSSLFVGRINEQIKEVLAGLRKRIEVGSLSAIRDYISMKDAALQLVAISQRGQSGQIYHVASGLPISMRDFLKKRLSRAGLDFSIVDEAPALSFRSGYDVPVIYANISRTIALLDE
ncbi:NAD-dependent epimerase/dehydratase family protein [Pseudomonas sp. KK4]|uniref:NAD-dependent epimerase/dehydratase family protein n=1 Tax=Pseudomonas sp. KK4 TaxID=1855729 RepID=UPI0009F984A8|nr:NAD-dependent epimerase/dehydratase family protein [Pseudomonas sp. KK4]